MHRVGAVILGIEVVHPIFSISRMNQLANAQTQSFKIINKQTANIKAFL